MFENSNDKLRVNISSFIRSHFKSCTEIFLQRSIFRKKYFRQKLFGSKGGI